MCNDEEYRLRRQLKLAQRHGASEELIRELTEKILQYQTPIEKEMKEAQEINPDETLDQMLDRLPEYYHVSGFTHPPRVVFSSLQPMKAEVAEWGFVGSWAKTVDEAYDYKKPANNTTNIQSEHMFEKTGFAKSARWGRCVVAIDAYYEHHHYNGKTYPFRIFRKDGEPLYIAAIAIKNKLLDKATGEEVTKITMGTLTTRANGLLERIHNNPALLERAGPRMLVILDEEKVNEYLTPYPYGPRDVADPVVDQDFRQKILNLCQPYDETKLGWHTVRNLRSRKDMPYLGNVPEIAEPYEWKDFDYSRIEKAE